jgi:5'-methylthioadenosine phosphorylase
MVLVDQFIDRTTRRPSTFFGSGIAAHVSLADPTCPELRSALRTAAEIGDLRSHDGGTYVCMEGPAFSTRAESELYRSWGAQVIGMTNMQEARLSREAEICYSTLALVTDYDCWHEDEDDVSVAGVLENLRANASAAATIVRETIGALPERTGGCGCAGALEHAIITRREAITPATRRRLGPIVDKYLT